MLETNALPALNTTLFGAFQVIDRSIKAALTKQAHNPVQSSYVDFAFGSEKSSFAGVHRFMVHRGDGSDPDDGSILRIEFASMACNPIENKPIAPAFLYTFHKFYAQLLFREGVRQVLEDLGQDGTQTRG